jgi:AhpD family alkylhydroperoxidase
MKPRMDYFRASPQGMQAMRALQAYVKACGLERSLLELVYMRASQINGCAYCLDMHSKDARAAGETEQRLYLLDAWREAPFRRKGNGHVPDEAYAAARQHFSEEELANLTIAVVAINGWNRLAIAFRAPAGTYRVGMFERPDK